MRDSISAQRRSVMNGGVKGSISAAVRTYKSSNTSLIQQLPSHQLQRKHTLQLHQHTFTMVSNSCCDKFILLLCICILYYTRLADCRPLSRRSISEVQLMHSVGVRKHVQQRQDWLEAHMQDIHTAPLHDGKVGAERNPSRRLLPGDLMFSTQNKPGHIGHNMEKLHSQ